MIGFSDNERRVRVSDKYQQCAVWAKKLESACKEDEWGLVLDAADQYESVMRAIASSVHNNNSAQLSSSSSVEQQTSTPPLITWDDNESEFLHNVALCLKQRVDVIQSPISKEKQFPRQNISEIIVPLQKFPLQFPSTLKSVISTNHNQYSSSQSEHSIRQQQSAMVAKLQAGKMVEMDSGVEQLLEKKAKRKTSLFESLEFGGRVETIGALDEEGSSEDDSNGTDVSKETSSRNGLYQVSSNIVIAVARPGYLLPLPQKKQQETLLSVKIEKVGLKDALKLVDSYWVVSVKDSVGLDVTPIQQTPSCGLCSELYITFNTTVHIQKSLESLPHNWVIFFELKHPREKKGDTVKCWAMLEREELPRGESERVKDVVLELYKKPTNFKRKKLQLLTSKELYLHVQLIKQ